MSWQSVDGIGCCPATGKSASAPAPSGNPAEARSPVEKFKLVLKSGDNLPLATGLRCRVRYFIAGAVLGSEAFMGRVGGTRGLRKEAIRFGC